MSGAASQKSPARFPEAVSGAEMATLMGVSPRTLDTWVQRGVLVRAGRGQYRLQESLTRYAQALRDRADAAPTGASDLALERAKTFRVRTQLKQRELDEINRDTLTADEIKEAWAFFAGLIRTSVDALPGRARQALPALTAHDLTTIHSLCRDILHDLADEAENVIGANPKELTDARL